MIDEFPDYWVGYYCLGEAYASLENTGMARRYFDKTLKMYPENRYAAEAIKRLESAPAKN